MLMGRHLTDRDVERVIEILDGWKDSLTWSKLIDVCRKRLGIQAVRQTLYRSVSIREAFELAKERAKANLPDLPIPSSLRAAAERIRRLEAENTRLHRQNDALLQQFVVWQYNAHLKGMSEQELNRALPEVDLGVKRNSKSSSSTA
jgi:hypothetical protein